MTQLLNSRDIEFLLYEFLDTESLLKRPRYQEHSREVFNATLETAQTIARKYFADHNAKGDANEPTFDGKTVSLIPETKIAWDAFAEAGFLAAHYDFDEGGMQMPEIILRAAMAYFNAANVATTAYPFLCIGAANLVNSFGSDEQKAKFLPPMQDGRFAGTMALTEPNQGSALADISTTAKLGDDGQYRIFGQKMFISGGDHPLTENIIHLVLAKIQGGPPGAKGISLFICPKFLVNDDGSLGKRNDVALAGLLHKMGYRNTTSTVLNFGEEDGAIAYLIGEAHKGLQYMFQMMNEARIGVGLGAAVLAYQGYNYSLEYSRTRLQGRRPSNKDPLSKQCALIEHADVRRLLLAQKVYAEGALAMCLYASALYEDSRTSASKDEQEKAFLLLDLITPVVKSWSSAYGLKANELAIQVLGGSGYIREYPVEQYYRDNRLNPIHEGAEAIHGLDILGRKVGMNGGAGFSLFVETVELTLAEAKKFSATENMVAPLEKSLVLLQETTAFLLSKIKEDPDLTLANATIYLDFFGRVVAAWLWLKQGIAAAQAIEELTPENSDHQFYSGKIQAAKYFMQWELPQTTPQAELLKSLDPVPFEMKDEWF